MTDTQGSTSLGMRIRGWLYERCFNYCIRFMHPEADPAEFCFLDMVNFVAVSKDEINELVEEAPAIAWHFMEGD